MPVSLKKNCEFFRQLLVLLESGYPLHEILTLLGEQHAHQELQEKTFIELYINSQHSYFHQHLQFLIKHLPLTTALKYSLALEDFRLQMRKTIIQKITYPLFLFGSANVLLCFFLGHIYPQITSNFSINNHHSLLHTLIILFLGTVITTTALILCSLSCLFLLKVTNHHWYPQLLLTINYHFPIGRRYFSLIFLYYFLYLQHSGLPSKDIILFLTELRCNPVVNHIVHHIHHQLQAGQKLLTTIENNRFLHPEVQMIFKLKITCKELPETTDKIIHFQLLKLQNAIQKLTIGCSVIAYGTIFLMMITIYQFLLIPLEMIQEF